MNEYILLYNENFYWAVSVSESCLSTNSSSIFCGCHGSRSHLPEAIASRHFLETQQTWTSPTGQDNCHRGQ